MTSPDHRAVLVEAEEYAGGPMVPATGIDHRDAVDILAGPHAIAALPYGLRLVRGVDRFTHLPTRERAAVVWVQRHARVRTVQTETVALDKITLHPGGDS